MWLYKKGVGMLEPWNRGVRKGGTMNKYIMTQNMLVMKQVLDYCNIPFVLIFGSLLGVIRDGDFIDWDSDADIACFSKDHTKFLEAVKMLEARGFTIPNRNECPLHDTFLIRNSEKIDIWWFDKIDDEYIYDNNIRYPQKYFDDLITKRFLGVDWVIPNNPESFLTFTYGDDWSVPNKDKAYILGRK